MIHLDTTFLVDLIREKKRQIAGPATTWLSRNQEEQVAVSVLVVCELMLGAQLHIDPPAEIRRVRLLLSDLVLVPLDEKVPAIYATAAASLIRGGNAIATMDLLIASVALREEAAILTRNVKHFERIPGINVLSY